MGLLNINSKVFLNRVTKIAKNTIAMPIVIKASEQMEKNRQTNARTDLGERWVTEH